MHERKQMMFDYSNAFVALPGGIGTLEEFVEQLTWAGLGHHKKPILLANINSFWDPFVGMISHMKGQGLLHGSTDERFLLAGDVDEILPLLRANRDFDGRSVATPSMEGKF